MAIIEGFWDCPYCGSRAIRGSEQKCPNCGKTRSAETKFYMKGTTPVADESAVEKGPDWFCPFCDSYNAHSARFCKNCGHERESTDRDYYAVRDDQAKKEEERRAEYDRLTKPQESSARSKASPGRWIALALILALLAAGIFALLPHDHAVLVADKFWQRTIDVEEYRLVQEDGWDLPSDAVELLRTARELHHYDSVLDHYETVTETKSREVLDGYDTYTTYNDLGNGYFESEEHSVPRYRTEYYTETREVPVYVQVPVYETKYYYTVRRWEYDRTETASGVSDPHWPDIGYSDRERPGAQSEKYTVTCESAKGQQTTYPCDYDIWASLQMGSRYKVRVQNGRIIAAETEGTS